MKTIPPSCPEPEVGPKYWRSLDQLADTPEFRQWVEKEFPTGASEFSDPTSRRNFVKIMSASFLLGGLGLTGCRRPEEKIYPFAKQPEDYIHGVPQFYATAMPTRRSAVPLVVKSSDGRPTKIEGNPDHPDSNGGTDQFTQASILNLYDPDRAMRFAENGSVRTRQQTLDFLASLSKKAQSGDRPGDGLAVLFEQSNSPSRARLQELITKKFPYAHWYGYEPIDLDGQSQAASMVYGKSVKPYYNLDRAGVILSFDCDFMGSEENSAINIRQFADGRRRLEKTDGSMTRLYAVESLFTLTGANADHRLRISPSMMTAIVARFASKILKSIHVGEFGKTLEDIAAPAHVHDNWIGPCAKDIVENAGKHGSSLVLGGHRLPLVAHLLITAINQSLGAVGRTVEFHEQPPAQPEKSIADLALELKNGSVETPVILGGNPVYNAPRNLIINEPELDWAKLQARAKTVVRLGYYEDETAFSSSLYADASAKPAHWDLPASHFLESWGDARTADGTLVPIQPLIDPLFGGLTELEVLAHIGGLSTTSSYEIVRETFRGIGGASEDDWKKFLHDGYLAGSAAKSLPVQYNWSVAPAEIRNAVDILSNVTLPDEKKMDVVFHRDYSVDDGRYINNGWLQEFPDPITKLTWDNAILLSPATAKKFDLWHEKRAQNQRFVSDVVEIELIDQGKKRTVRGPIWVQPGMADNTIGLSLGYGRERTGRIGRKSGYDAYQVRTASALHYASGATMRKTGETSVLATTQSHWAMEGRPIVREANLDEFQKNPKFVNKMDMEKPPVFSPLYPNPLDAVKSTALHQWGMSIDLNTCVGCSACVIACQSENNIPIVGKQMVGKSREMHWIRIDRYYAGGTDDPQAVTQPMLCQHCEAAPCENVCPVNATSHDEEGLNVMTYNRCVGTRYCSNNCPYKVRRFNFFDYNRRPLDQLYKSPLISTTEGEWELMRWFKDPDRGSRPDDHSNRRRQ